MAKRHKCNISCKLIIRINTVVLKTGIIELNRYFLYNYINIFLLQMYRVVMVDDWTSDVSNSWIEADNICR